jgi:hypothetical protein
VFAQIHGRQGLHGVGVVGACDHHRIDVLLLLEHLAKVGIALRFRDLRLQRLPVLGLLQRALFQHGIGSLGGALVRGVELVGDVREPCIDVRPVDVAQGHVVHAGQRLQIGAAHAAAADGCDIDAIIGGNTSWTAVRARGEQGERGCRGGAGLQKIPARHRSAGG